MKHLSLFLAVVLSLPIGLALAERVRVGGALEMGQYRYQSCDVSELRRFQGGKVFADWSGENFRLSAGYRLLRQQVSQVDSGDTYREGNTQTSQAGSVLAGFESRWIHLAGGVGFMDDSALTGEINSRPQLVPATYVRLGPRDVVYLEGSLMEFSPWSIAPGLINLGVGATPWNSRVWVGVAGGPGFGVGAAAELPVTENASLQVAGAIDPDKGEYYDLQVGLVVTPFKEETKPAKPAAEPPPVETVPVP